MRTTIDIDDPIMDDLKRLQKQEGKTLGRLVSDLLAQAITQKTVGQRPTFKWHARAMQARVNLAAVLRVNGVRVLYTRDRDFLKFPSLDVRDPIGTT